MTRTKRRLRWALGGLVLCGLIATSSTVALATSSSAPKAAQATVPGCTTAGLVIWLNTTSNGAAGSFYYTLELTNLSGHTCSLYGWPGVSGVNLSGKQVGGAAVRDVVAKPKLVKLINGARAIATLRVTDTGVYSQSQCGQTTAAGLRVYPPGSTISKVVPFPLGACSTTTASYLSVTAVASSGSGAAV